MQEAISEATKQQLTHAEPGERQLAVKKVTSKMSAEARDLIVERLAVEDHPSVIEWLCIGARHTLAFDAIPKLLNLTHHSVPDVRRFACEGLRIGQDRKIVDRLENLSLEDADYNVRFAAIRSLKKIGLRLFHRSEVEEAKAISQRLKSIERQLKSAAKCVRRTGVEDLGQAAALSSRQIDTHIERATGGLFSPDEISDVTDAADYLKMKRFAPVSHFLRANGVTPKTVEYVFNVIRSITRDRSLRILQGKEGITQCQLCEQPFFFNKSGHLSFQMAHIKALSNGGKDAAENTLFLCASCHAQLDLAKQTKITETSDYIFIALPSGAKQAFKKVAGKRPEIIPVDSLLTARDRENK